MIIPTRTVCTCVMGEEYTYRGMKRFTLTPKIAEEINNVGAWSFVKQIIVREEPIKYSYPLCNKTLNPFNPCDCGDCEAVLKFFSNIKSLPL